MILVLCEDYLNSCDAFDCFVDFLEHNEPWELRTVQPSANLVITDDDLHYIFIHRGYLPVIDTKTVDLIDVDDFFNDIIDRYYYGG